MQDSLIKNTFFIFIIFLFKYNGGKRTHKIQVLLSYTKKKKLLTENLTKITISPFNGQF